MPRRRLQVDSGVRPAGLQPVASPVDTFVRTDAGTKLAQLAQGLSAIAPEVRQFTGTLIAEHDEKERQRGVQDARDLIVRLRAEHKTLTQAVKDGTIPRHANPFYVAGVKEQMGRVSADTWHSDFVAALASDPTMQNSTSMDDFDAFVQKHQQEYLKDHIGDEAKDTSFAIGFGSRSDAYINQERERFAYGIGQKIEANGNTGQFEEMHAAIRREWNSVPKEQLAADLKTLADSLVKNQGRDGTQVNQITVAAITQAAIRLDDKSVLDLLDMLPGGGSKNSKLSDTSYGSEARKKALAAIMQQDSQQNSLATQQYQKEQREKAQAVDDVIHGATAALEGADDPHTVDLSQFREAMLKADPSKVGLLYSMQAAWSDQEYTDDPSVKAHLFLRVNGLDQDHPGFLTSRTLAQALASRTITTGTYTQLMQMIQTRDSAKGGAKNFLSDDGLQLAREEMKRYFVSESGFFDTAETRQRAVAADAAISQAYFRWREGAGKDAAPSDINKWVYEETRALFPLYGAPNKVSAWRKLPEGNLTPAPFDWRRQRAVDETNLTTVRKDVQQWLGSGKKTPLSQYTLNILKSAGVPPDAESITQFLSVQGLIGATSDAPRFQPDTTTNQ